ncbi:hypothetical protein TNCV_994251 [Trichonephila clavipes]|nr:hypothetical protein TNCV_994251 [Trichonephila clavipes]
MANIRLTSGSSQREERNLSQQINYCIFDQVVMSILEKLAKISKMEVDPSDKNQSPCFQRHQILKKIELEKMTLKTFRSFTKNIQNSDPSLAETTNDAADEHQLKLDTLDKIDNSASKTTLKSNSNKINNNKNKSLISVSLKRFHGGLCLPYENCQTCFSFNQRASRNNQQFSNLEEDKNQEVEEEAKIAVVPKPRPHNPFILKLQKTFEIK